MWTSFITIKMKNIGEEKTIKQLQRIVKKRTPYLTLGKKTKDYLIFVSGDGPVSIASIKEFSRKHKGQIIGVLVDRVHNAFSRYKERDENIYWDYYRDGDLILCYALEKNREKFYKCTKPNYEDLILKATVGDIISCLDDTKETLRFFKIKNKKKYHDIVKISYKDFMSKYSEYDLFEVFGDIEHENTKKISYDAFLNYFSKVEQTLFKKDFKR